VKTELVEYKLIDWVLFNIDLIKQLLKEMKYTGAAVVYSDSPGLEVVIDKMERIIVFVDDALKVVETIEKAIEKICEDDDLFDIFTEVYFEQRKLADIPIVLREKHQKQISERTVKTKKRQIQNIVKKYLSDEDIEIEFIASLMSALKINPKVQRHHKKVQKSFAKIALL